MAIYGEMKAMKETKPRLRCPNCKEVLLVYQVKPVIEGKGKYITVHAEEEKFCPKCFKKVMVENAVIKTVEKKVEVTYTKQMEK